MIADSLKKLTPFILVFVAGLVSAFAMPPTSLWFVLFFGLSCLYYFFSKTQSKIAAFSIGFSFALGYFLSGLWWIGNALLVEGNDYAWVWPVAVIGLPTLLAFFTGLATLLIRVLAPQKRWKEFIGFCVSIALFEWIRGHIFTGFPWNLYGYTWSEYLPMAQISFYIGAYGLTLATIIIAAFPAFLITNQLSKKLKIIISLILLSIVTLNYIYGHSRLTNNPTTYHADTTVHLVQPNIAQDQKWLYEKLPDHFETHLQLSKPQSADKNKTIIIWPETAIPNGFIDHPNAIKRIKSLLNKYPQHSTLIAGALRIEKTPKTTRYYNSMVIYDQSTTWQPLYDKSHLVPFGEYIPLQKWIPLKPVVEFSGFQRGQGTQTITMQNIPAFSPLICYEIIFPGDVIAKNPINPKWIINITNDAWYDKSAGPYQHFAQTRMRAIEEGIPVIRSANTGISGVIDPYGRILKQTNIFEQTALQSQLPLPATSKEKIIIVDQWAFPIFCILIIAALLYRYRQA